MLCDHRLQPDFRSPRTCMAHASLLACLAAAIITLPAQAQNVRTRFTGGSLVGGGSPSGITNTFPSTSNPFKPPVIIADRGGSGGGTTGGGLPCASGSNIGASIQESSTATTIIMSGSILHGTSCGASSDATAFFGTSEPIFLEVRERTTFQITNNSEIVRNDGQDPSPSDPVIFTPMTGSIVSNQLRPGTYQINFSIFAGGNGSSLVTRNTMDWRLRLERTDTSTRDTLDYDGDAHDDIFFHNAAFGTVLGYDPSQSIGINGFHTLQATDPVFALSASGDMNADGKADLLWTNPLSGENYVWLTNGIEGNGNANRPTSLFLPSMPGGWSPGTWKLAGVGDFDGDFKNDILLFNTQDRNLWVYLMDGITYRSARWLSSFPAGWDVRTASDYNADGSPDVIVVNTTTGDLGILFTDNFACTWQSIARVGPNWEVVGRGDLATPGRDRDGYQDILWRNTVTGGLALWHIVPTGSGGSGAGARYDGWGYLPTPLDNDPRWRIRN
jgi:hypothetical protein